MVVMSCVLQVIILCSALKVSWHSGGTCCLLLQARFLLGLIFDPEDRRHIALKYWLTFIRLYDVISQKAYLTLCVSIHKNTTSYFEMLNK